MTGHPASLIVQMSGERYFWFHSRAEVLHFLGTWESPKELVKQADSYVLPLEILIQILRWGSGDCISKHRRKFLSGLTVPGLPGHVLPCPPSFFSVPSVIRNLPRPLCPPRGHGRLLPTPRSPGGLPPLQAHHKEQVVRGIQRTWFPPARKRLVAQRRPKFTSNGSRILPNEVKTCETPRSGKSPSITRKWHTDVSGSFPFHAWLLPYSKTT